MKILSNYLQSLTTRYRRRKLALKTINKLKKLRKKELMDIGIARGEIRHLAWNDAKKRVPVVEPSETGVVNPNLRGFV